jgi:CelD/BcsL family acetyltransferase involved in cellulose biosynthesis
MSSSVLAGPLRETGIVARSVEAATERRGLAARVLDREQIQAISPAAWARLSKTSLVDNPFYARPYLLAAMDTIDRGRSLEAVALEARGGGLYGLIPFERRFGVAFAARNPYQFACAPLLDRAMAPQAVEAWLRAIADRALPGAWCFRDVALDGPLISIIEASAARHELDVLTVLPYGRAKLDRGLGSFERHAETVLSSNRRKDVERQLRRLRQRGQIAFERTACPSLVAQRVEDFLRLELAGWKGRAGTAFLCRPSHAAFARKAFSGSEGGGLAVVDSLLLDGIPIAISINIAAGATGFTPKCTYDEAFRSYGPGVVLEYLALKAFYEDERFDDMDAATTVDGHLIEGLWNGRASMGTLLLGGPRRIRLLARLLAAQASAKAELKRVLNRP